MYHVSGLLALSGVSPKTEDLSGPKSATPTPAAAIAAAAAKEEEKKEEKKKPKKLTLKEKIQAELNGLSSNETTTTTTTTTTKRIEKKLQTSWPRYTTKRV